MKTLFVGTLCLFASQLFGQLEVGAVAEKSLPSWIEYQGVFSGALKLVDKNGSSLIIVSHTPVQPSKTWPDSKESELFVYRYLTQPTSATQLWQVYDFVKECPVDIEARFISGGLINGVDITDLDKDDDFEVWISYLLACRGDVSPATVKIVMYEGKTKYTMKGKSKVKVSETEYQGGTYEMDKDLRAASSVFKDYAKVFWQMVVDSEAAVRERDSK